MSFIKGLLLDISSSDVISGLSGAANSAYGAFKQIIDIVLPVILGSVLLVGIVYAVYLGVKYSKAEEAEKRKEAKQQLVGAIVGFVITLALIAVIYIVLSSGAVKTIIGKTGK